LDTENSPLAAQYLSSSSHPIQAINRAKGRYLAAEELLKNFLISTLYPWFVHLCSRLDEYETFF
jgi:hypothetical protein